MRASPRALLVAAGLLSAFPVSASDVPAGSASLELLAERFVEAVARRQVHLETCDLDDPERLIEDVDALADMDIIDEPRARLADIMANARTQAIACDRDTLMGVHRTAVEALERLEAALNAR